MWCSNAKGTTHEKSIGFAEWIFSYSLGCHLWLYERTNFLKKRERRSLASREGYRRLQYNVQHNHIFAAQNQPQKYIHSFWELQQMFTYLKWRTTALPTPIKHFLRGENINNKPNKTKQQNQNMYMTYLWISVPQLLNLRLLGYKKT